MLDFVGLGGLGTAGIEPTVAETGIRGGGGGMDSCFVVFVSLVFSV